MQPPRMKSALAILALVILANRDLRAADPYENAPPYAVPADTKAKLRPIVTTGQQIPLTGGLPGETFRILGIPDGMGLYGWGPKVNHQLVLLMNHEFRQAQGLAFGSLPAGARASQLLVAYNSSASVVSGKLAFDRVFDGETGTEIAPLKGLSRLCSAFLAGENVGFDRPIFLHGEENPSPDTFDSQGGSAFATFEGKTYKLPRIGHAEWENIVALPFTGNKTVVFALEDGPALGSQIYMYVGDKAPSSSNPLTRNGLNNGNLYVFAGDDASLNSEETVNSKGQSVGGHWESISYLGTDTELNTRSIAVGAFGFVRIEDGAPDPKAPGVFYFVTTGSPNTVNPFGRLYRLQFDPANPTGPVTLTILLDGSEGIVSPDNIDINKHGELIMCEDPNYNLSTAPLNLTRDTSLWAYNTHTGKLLRIAEIDRNTAFNHALAADPGNSSSTLGTPGGWEFSGIVDAEEFLGRGSWLVDIQAHTLRIAPTSATVEGGQVLHLIWKPSDDENN
jgi:hypothetical protein